MSCIAHRRRVAHVLACAALALGLAACESPEERHKAHYERGLALLEEGSVEKAIIEFRNALRIDADDAALRRAMGAAMERSGDIRAAVGQYRAAAELDDRDVESRIWLAKIFTLANDLEEARAQADAALAIAPENPDALAARAAVRLRSGDGDGAVEDARTALENDALNLAAAMVLVSERVQAGDLDAALARTETLIADHPDDITPRVAKLRLLATQGDSAAVGAELATIAETFPNELQFRRSYVQWRIQNGDLEGAEADLRAIAAEEPDDLQRQLDVLRFVYVTRGLEAARAEFDSKIAETDAAVSTSLRLALADLYYQNDRHDLAEETLKALIANQGEEDASLEARNQLARIHLADGDTDAAHALVDEVLEADSENVDALALRASMAIDEYRVEEAIADLRVALASDPQNARLMLLEARAHERNGNLTLAGERLAAATRASEYAPDTAMRYAAFLTQRDQTSAAEAVLTEAARRNPSDRALLTRLAEIRLRLQDWTGADQAAAMLRALDSDDTTADQILAAALSGQGRTDDSIRILESVVSEGQGGENALASLVSTYVRAGETDKAVTLLDRVLADNPHDTRALLLRAELHLLAGDAAKAEAKLREVIAAAPDSQIGYIALTRFLIQSGRDDEALTVTDQAIEKIATSQPLRLLRAQLFETFANFEAAIADYKVLYEANPESLVYANNLASLLAEHRSDDADSMVFAARVANRLRGYEIPHLQDTYGWIMFLNGEVDTALRSLVRAVEGLPDNALVQYHVGRAFAADGNPIQARDHLEAALAIDPNFVKAASARETLAALPQGSASVD